MLIKYDTTYQNEHLVIFFCSFNCNKIMNIYENETNFCFNCDDKSQLKLILKL